ncbi:unnamed protein product [Gordionus sp. m RMFG-2023]
MGNCCKKPPEPVPAPLPAKLPPNLSPPIPLPRHQCDVVPLTPIPENPADQYIHLPESIKKSEAINIPPKQEP